MEMPKAAPSPKPSKPSGFKARPNFDRKKMTMIGGVVVGVLLLILVGTQITGAATANSVLAAELNSTSANLTLCRDDTSRLEGDLQSAKSDLNRARSDADDCNSNLNSAVNQKQECLDSRVSLENAASEEKAKTDACMDEKSQIADEMNTYKNGYDTLAENYAADVCCTRGVSQANWDVVNNAIVCSGNRTVSCA